MQSNPKPMQISIKHVEPIKIRKVRVSSRKTKKPASYDEQTYSTEYGNSTAVTRKSMAQGYTSRVSNNKNNMNFSHTLSRNEQIEDIQEIHENVENDDDSVILELSELLSEQITVKNEPVDKDSGKKNTLTGFKVRMKERIVPIKSERVLPRNLSQRVLFK
ncbi:hypothetical protein SteCoe_17016 [Stentor coeruleus]|uniref:Uncharacterized protein n=1 Tax=Stentor coeruleus TaxID=5963 RepID=A0A1R2BZU1_9CILI|nr:hypothetical protein SteCoe_17016 [Stentor coeruleus]